VGHVALAQLFTQMLAPIEPVQTLPASQVASEPQGAPHTPALQPRPGAQSVADLQVAPAPVPAVAQTFAPSAVPRETHASPLGQAPPLPQSDRHAPLVQRVPVGHGTVAPQLRRQVAEAQVRLGVKFGQS
jgi:hypothetical protein